jgi:uncharacterized membrane protein YfcA
MIPLSFQAYLIVFPLVFLGGFIDSIAGGGGLLTLPAYYLTGLDPAWAGGSNKISAVFGTAVAAGKYIKKGHVDGRCGLASLAGSVPGAAMGSWLLTVLPGQYVKIGVLLALPLVAFFVFRKKDLSVSQALVPPRFGLAASFLIGLLIGSYDGLVGPGTGTFLMLCYVSLLGMPALSASGTARLVNLGSNLGSAITMMLAGRVLYALALPAALFSILGNVLGANLAIKKGAPFIRILLLVVLGMLLAALLWDVIQG